MEKVQIRVATEVPVGKCGYVGEYVEGKSSRTPYWMDQALEWMEEKNFTFEGGVRLEGAVPGDVALVDMASNAIERKVMQRATMATGRRWLSQVISATGDSVVTTSGVPNKEQWAGDGGGESYEENKKGTRPAVYINKGKSDGWVYM